MFPVVSYKPHFSAWRGIVISGGPRHEHMRGVHEAATSSFNYQDGPSPYTEILHYTTLANHDI
jgi:hypothetical protein